MRKKRLTIGYNKKKIRVIAEDCGIWKKFSGLMFSRRETAKILLFSFKRKQKIAIHSFFVFYPFIAIWLDKTNNVMDLKIVRPFTPCVSPSRDSYSLVEIPLNKRNKKIARLLKLDDNFA